MKSATTAVLAAALLASAACAPVIRGGPPIDLPPGLQETAQVGTIFMSSDWLNATDDFSETFSDEVHEELKRCMWGTAPIDVRIHIDDMRRTDRLETLLNGHGVHTLSGTVEFVHPAAGNRVLGRFPVSVATGAQGRLGALIGDRQMMVSEEFGRAVCEQAFGGTRATAGPKCDAGVGGSGPLRDPKTVCDPLRTESTASRRPVGLANPYLRLRGNP